MKKLLLTLSLGLLLAACSNGNGVTHEFGPASATGTLIHSDVSLLRRGTHALVIDGETKYYVESRTQNLSDYEGRTVYVEGKLEANIEGEEIPVLIVEKVTGPNQNEDLRRFEIPALNLRLGIPMSWKGSIEGGVASFVTSDGTAALMTIRLLSGSSLPPGGTTFYVKNRPSTRTNGTEGSSDILILERGTIVSLRFDPSTQTQLTTEEERDILVAQFERVLGTISFIADKEVPATATGSSLSTPCGGTAGIVCPSGSFCDITDFENRIGQCRKR